MLADLAAEATGEPLPAEEVLRALESAKVTGRVVFSTGVGAAEVRVKDGALIAARLDELRGRGALFRLLGAGKVRHRVFGEPIDFDTPITPSVDGLVASLSRWHELSLRAPPLSSVLERAPVDSAVPIPDEPERSLLLGLVDGRRTLGEVLDASGLDPIRALSLAVECVENEALQVRAVAASLFPLPGEAADALPDLAAPPPLRSLAELSLLDRELESDAADFEPAAQVLDSTAEPEAAAPSSSRSGPVPAESGPVPTKVAAKPAPAPPSIPAEKNRAAFVGRYEVLCRIGRGGMGSVYLSRLNSEGGFRRLFALKLLRNHLVEDGDAARRFLDEARLAGHMHHPNVVGVVDAGLFGSRPYLVMDYVEGASLRELLDARVRPMPQSIAISIVLDALAGLDATHTLVSDEGRALGIVHADVSPENLLIGVDGVCRLSDFGIARSVVSGARRQRTTHGKPAYLAPEQVLGGSVDQRADIFAMGTLLYEALTGVPLFQAPTAEASLQQVCVRKIPLPSSVGSRPSPSLDWVCMKALERDPKQRFGTAQEMLTELRRVALREELLAATPEVAARVRSTVGRQLAQRRLFVLESARGGAPSSEASLSDVAPLRTPDVRRSKSQRSLSVRPSVSAVAESSAERRQQDQPPARSIGRSLLILVSVLAVLAVIAAAIWPEDARDWLSRVTSSAGWRTLDGDPAAFE